MWGVGFINKPETLKESQSLLESIGQSDAFSIAGGGDTTSIIHFLKMENKINFLSTGGGSTLSYLAEKKLPGLF